MLSIKKARELIEGDENYTDEEVEKIWNDLYSLAEIAIESYKGKLYEKRKKNY